MAITPGRIYYITNQATNTYLDLSGSNNSSIIGYQNNGGHDNQRWLVNKSGDGYTFQNLRNFSYLTVSAYASQAQLTIGPVPAVFSATASGNGYVFRLPGSNNFVIDLSGSSSANSTPVILYAAHGGANQTWILTPVPAT